MPQLTVTGTNTAEPGEPATRATRATRATSMMMMHLEISVDDLEASVAHAIEAGAALADFQPQYDVRVCLDPAGHPFCPVPRIGPPRPTRRYGRVWRPSGRFGRDCAASCGVAR